MTQATSQQFFDNYTDNQKSAKQVKQLFVEVEEKKPNNNSLKSHIVETSKKDLVSDGKDPEGLFFSKGIVVICAVLFVAVMIRVFTMHDVSNGYLTTVYVTGVTGVSGALITSVVWYLKKTHTAYVAKVETQLYKDTIGIQYSYTIALMQKQHDLKLTDAEMAKVENSLSAKMVSNSVFNEAQTNVKSSKAEGTANIKKETVS